MVPDARRNPRSGNSHLTILGTKLAVSPEGGYQTGDLGAPGYQTPQFCRQFLDMRYQTPQFCHTSCTARYQPGNSAMRKVCGIFVCRAAVYSIANKWPHSFHLGFPKFLKSHPSLTPQPEAAFCQGWRRPAARGCFLPEPASARSPKPLFVKARGRPVTRGRSCRR